MIERPLSSLPRILVAVLPVAAAAVLGSVATRPEIPAWYAGLSKPSFTPPNWVFGPVWTLLFAMMAYAVFRILSLPPDRPGRREALVAFWVQLALNTAWSFAFFAARSPGAGLVVIGLLLIAILMTLGRFLSLDRVAGWLLAPYLAWVSYATALNLAIWRINP